MCFFLFSSLKDMFADGTVFSDMYFDKEWPVLAYCLAASLVLPKIMTWSFLMSASLSNWTDFVSVIVAPLVGWTSYFGLLFHHQPMWMQKGALGLVCCSAIPLSNFCRGIKAGEPPLSSGATWWEVAEGMIGAPFSGVLTLYGAFLTREAPSNAFALSVVFSCFSTSVAAHKLNTVGEKTGVLELFIGTVKQLPEITFRILFLATMAFLTHPVEDSSADEPQSNRCYVAIAFVSWELAANSLLLIMHTKMGPAVTCLFSFAMLIGYPPKSLVALGKLRNYHRVLRLCSSGVAAVLVGVLQASLRQMNPSDDRLEMLWTNYWLVVLVMLLCYFEAWCSGIGGLYAIHNCPVEDGVVTKWTKYRRVQAAIETNDPIMAGLLANDIKRPSTTLQGGNEIPVAVVHGFCVSGLMGRTLIQLYKVDEAALHKCFTVDDSPRASTEVAAVAEEGSGTRDIVTRFEKWKTAHAEQDTSAHMLGNDNAMLTQLLICCGKAKTLNVDLGSIQQAMDMRGKLSEVCVQDPSGVSQGGDWSHLFKDFVQWMRLCEVRHFTCPVSDYALKFLGWVIQDGKVVGQLPNLQSITLSRGCEISDQAISRICETLLHVEVLKGISFSIQGGNSHSALQQLVNAIRSAPKSLSIKLFLKDQRDTTGRRIVDAIQHASTLTSLSCSEPILGDAVVLFSEAMKNAEALQDIRLSLGGLSDDRAKILLEAIREVQSLRGISISGGLSDSSFHLLSNAIQFAPVLQSISLDCGYLSDCSMKFLNVAIRHAPSLQSVTFAGGFSQSSLSDFSSALSRGPALKSISLDCTGVRKDGLQPLAHAVIIAPSLQSISLSLKDFNDRDLKSLAEAIRLAPALQSIALSFRVLSESSMEILSEAIRHAPALQNMNLDCEYGTAFGTRSCSDYTMKLLSEAIRHAPALESIRLCIRDPSAYSMELLSEAIRHAPALQSISFHCDGLEGDAMKLLGDGIRLVPALQSISFAGGLSADAMPPLSEAIRFAPALQSISFSGDLFGAGMKFLSDAIRHAPALQSISFSEGLFEDCVELLGEAIRHAPVLQSISLACQFPSKYHMKLLSEVIQHVPALQNISLAFHAISDDNAKLLGEAIRHAPVLHSVKLLGDIGDRSCFDGLVGCKVCFEDSFSHFRSP